MAAVPVSKAESDFTLRALQIEGVRVDGRALTACRKLSIKFGAAHGEVEVTLGPTRVLGVCTGEVVVPPPERPNEGRISFHVDFSPIASPSFESGRPSVQATTTANLIERLIKGSRAVDAEALCIVGGQQVWSIRVDVRALDDDGNLGDACAIAALCSLLHFRKADVEVKGEATQSYAAEDRVPVPLSIHHLPVPVTIALFEAAKGGRQKSSAPTWLLDPNRLEEAVASGALCVAVNQHGELCGLHKPGGMPIEYSIIEQCTEVAIQRAQEITARIQAELAQDAEQRKKSRRNIHQQFACDRLLTVDDVAATETTPKQRLSEQVQKATAAPAEHSTELGAGEAVDINAALQAVADETAELEAQLAAAESAVQGGGALGSTTKKAGGARQSRKKRRVG